MNTLCGNCIHQNVCQYCSEYCGLIQKFTSSYEITCKYFLRRAEKPEADEIDRLRSRAENLTLYLDYAIAAGPEGVQEKMEEKFSGMPGYISKKTEREEMQNDVR